MRELLIETAQAGQRLDKFLARCLPEASKSFLYRMLRKKNITLNDKKAQGNELLSARDVVRVWFSDETYLRFAGREETPETLRGQYPYVPLEILYEDEHTIFINKPAGMLSQRTEGEERSVCEYLIGYLLHTGQIDGEDLKRFRPSVCSRLDRNTSGVVACGKTVAGLSALSELFRERTLHKYYTCIVEGEVSREKLLDAYLVKDEASNTVRVMEGPVSGAKRIVTRYVPLLHGQVLDGGGRAAAVTALEVLLITGRSHQIRAHLASDAHPIVGDMKYAPEASVRFFRRACQVRRQLLHCARLQLPGLAGPLAQLSGKVIAAPLPEDFLRVMPQLRGQP